jgi:hypothetical protein
MFKSKKFSCVIENYVIPTKTVSFLKLIPLIEFAFANWEPAKKYKYGRKAVLSP